jgi:hypothetical protein
LKKMNPKRKSREDWRKAKELEEARKAGTVRAAVDEERKDIPQLHGTSVLKVPP